MIEIKIMISVYLLLMMMTGICSFFRIGSVSDYFISGKKGSWWQVSGSLFATIIGGSAILGTIELSRNAGWAAVWFLGSASAGLLVLFLIAGKVSRYGHYTLPEMIGRFYGQKAEKTATILIPAAWLGVISVQVIAGARTLSSIQLMSYQQGAILCGSVFILYTLLGGQKSVLKTDFIQAIIILGGISLLFFLNIARTEDLPRSPFSPGALFNRNFTIVDLFILLITYSVTFTVGPDIYTRIFCARNEKTARLSVILVAFLILIIAVMLTYLGVNHLSGNPDQRYTSIIPGAGFLPPWGTGVVAVIMLSAIMSSADSTLLSSSTILTELVTGDLDKKGSLRLTRVFIVIMGMLAIVIATVISSVLNAMLISLSFFSGAFILPVIAGIAGWKVNKRMAYLAMIAGGLTALAGKMINEFLSVRYGYILILAAYVINAVLLFMPDSKKENLKSQHKI